MIEFQLQDLKSIEEFQKKVPLLPPNTLYRAFYSSDSWTIFLKCKKISKVHCETGPAAYCYGNYGYYLNGKSYTREEWETRVYNKKLKKILK